MPPGGPCRPWPPRATLTRLGYLEVPYPTQTPRSGNKFLANHHPGRSGLRGKAQVLGRTWLSRQERGGYRGHGHGHEKAGGRGLRIDARKPAPCSRRQGCPTLEPWKPIMPGLLTLFALVQGSITADPASGELPVDRGATGLRQALLRLQTTGPILHVTAHPDDEDSRRAALRAYGVELW
jgi:hypothetical protein